MICPSCRPVWVHEDLITLVTEEGEHHRNRPKGVRVLKSKKVIVAMTKKRNSRCYSPSTLTALLNPTLVATKRRQPLPKNPLPEFLIPVEEFPRPVVTNPHAQAIAELIIRVANVSNLNPIVVFGDWIGLIEGSLRLYGENLNTVVTTGKSIPAPPDIKAVYLRARERYTQLSLRYPAAYREMQEAFGVAYNILVKAISEWNLEQYVEQSVIGPDIVGQALVACVDLHRAWWPYFPPWDLAIDLARKALRGQENVVYEELARANLRCRDELGEQVIKFVPGENWEEWFKQIFPYYSPIILKPPLITSSSMMLAVAGLFPEWVRAWGMIEFYLPEQIDPLIYHGFKVTSYLYSLNGYALELTHQIIQAARSAEAQGRRLIFFDPDEEFDQTEWANLLPIEALAGLPLPPPPQPTSPPASAGTTFAELFQRSAGSK